MIFTVPELLTPDEVSHLVKLIAEEKFTDGSATAGEVAASVKQNLQLAGNEPARIESAKVLLGAMQRNASLRSAIQPKELHSVLVTKYEPGMEYGTHVDNAIMGRGVHVRADISLTVFLSDPNDYDGGELTVESGTGELRVKLKAGAMVCYPGSSLHKVEPVIRGARLALVGWVESLVREPAKREILYDLDCVKQSLYEGSGKTREYDLLAKSHANLLRRWAGT